MVIAEDEALIRLDLREMLEEAGFEVVAEAADGETAVALVAEHRPDLAVLDVKMPRLDGISAAEQIAAAPARPGGDADGVLAARAGRAGPGSRARWRTW